MGLVITASVSCDNCNGAQTPNAEIEDPTSPPPATWCRVQGYVNISGGASDAINGYFCPVCIVALGIKDLVKKSADIMVVEEPPV